jgi:hypothetical protein
MAAPGSIAPGTLGPAEPARALGAGPVTPPMRFWNSCATLGGIPGGAWLVADGRLVPIQMAAPTTSTMTATAPAMTPAGSSCFMEEPSCPR